MDDLDCPVELITGIPFAEPNKLSGLQMLLLSILTLWDHDFTLYWKSYSPSLKVEALTSMLMHKLLYSVIVRNEIREYFIKWNDYDLPKHIHMDKNVHTDGLTLWNM